MINNILKQRAIFLKMANDSHPQWRERQVVGAIKFLFISKFILVTGSRVTEAGEGSHRTVRNSSKMKLGTCASATLRGSFVYRT